MFFFGVVTSLKHLETQLDPCYINVWWKYFKEENKHKGINASCTFQQVKSSTSTSQVKMNPRNKAEIMESQPLRFMSAIYTLKLIFYVKHSRSRQQHGAYIKYSLVKSHQISIWTPVDLFYVIFPLFMN